MKKKKKGGATTQRFLLRNGTRRRIISNVGTKRGARGGGMWVNAGENTRVYPLKQ